MAVVPCYCVRNGWAELEDGVDHGASEWEKALKEAGYRWGRVFGDDRAGLSFVVYEHTQSDRFLLSVGIGNLETRTLLAAADLPALLVVLKDLLLLSGGALHLEQASRGLDRREHKPSQKAATGDHSTRRRKPRARPPGY